MRGAVDLAAGSLLCALIYTERERVSSRGGGCFVVVVVCVCVRLKISRSRVVYTFCWRPLASPSVNPRHKALLNPRSLILRDNA